MEIMMKNAKMVYETDGEYCCCLGCGIKISGADGAFECKKCEADFKQSDEWKQILKNQKGVVR